MRFASQRLFALIAVVSSLSIALTTLTAAPSMAYDPSSLHEMVFTQKDINPSGSMSGESMTVKYPWGTKYCNNGSYDDYKLSVKLINDTSGEVLWATPNMVNAPDGIANDTAYFNNVRFDYPGATFHAEGYAVCDPSLGGMPDPSASPIMDTAQVNINWDHNVAITDASFISPTSLLAHITDKDLIPLTYIVSDYGTDHATAVRSTSAPPQCNGSFFGSITPDNACIIFPNTNATYVGIAVVPDRLVSYSTTAWPVPGATSYAVADRTKMGGPLAIPSMTQNGPSKSTPTQSISSVDPIDNYSGNFYSNHTDASIAGRIGLSIDRNYSVSSSAASGAFGYGSSMNYDMHVSNNLLTNDASVVEENGNSIPFVYRSDSSDYATPSTAVRATLTRTGSGWDFSRWSDLLTYHFDSNGKLSSITDNNNNAVVVTRDTSSGQVTKVQEGDRWIGINWQAGTVESTTDNSGRSFHYTYDAQGNLTSVQDAGGNTSTYAYDSSHRITSLTNAVGGVTSNVYDAQGRVATQYAADGQATTMYYGTPSTTGIVSSQETTGDVYKTFSYIKGRLISYDNSADAAQSFSQSYNDSGYPLVSTSNSDPSGADTYYTYDAKWNVTGTLHSGTKVTESATWNDRNEPLSRTDKLGVITTYTYDSNGNLTSSVQQSADKLQARTTTYTVSPTGEVTSVTNPLGGVSTMISTPDGDLSSTVDPNGNKTSYAYDSLGRKLTSTSPGGNVSGVTDSSKFTTTNSYDANDNIVSVTGSLGVTNYAYDSLDRPVLITDPHGKTSSTSYDARSNPFVVTHADGSTDTFTYDKATGQKSSWTDSQGRVTTYLQRGTDTTTTSPDGTVSKTTHYQQGDPWGSSTYLTDPLNSNVLVSTRKINGSNSVVTNYASGVASTTTYAPTGLKTAEQTSNGTTSYTYDGFGAMTSSTSTAAGRNVAYSYDAAGNVTQITYPDGTSVSRTLDKAGRVTTANDWSGVVYTFGYTSDGKLGSVSASSGLSYQQNYDGTLPTDKTWKDGAGSVLAAFQSTYDDKGQLSGTASTVNGSSENNPLLWNANNQVSKTGTSPVAWQGNRVTATDKLQSLDYSAMTGRLTNTSDLASNATTFTYNAIGQRTSSVNNGQTINYSWNNLGQLTSAGSDTYAYDNSGLRSEVNNSQQVYGQDQKLLSDGTNKFLWSIDGSLLAQASLSAGTGATPSQAVTNSMGSVYEMLQAQPVPNSSGVYQFGVLAQYSYSLFGERSLVAGADVTDIGFVSEQLDATTGFIYLRARYYDPKTAQFISSDPMLSSTHDAYGYGGGNPLQMVDPLGLDFWGISSSDWSNIGTAVAVVGMVAAVASVTVLTGGTGLVLMTGLGYLTTGAGLAIGATRSVEDCSSHVDANCGWSIAGTVLSAVPLLGRVGTLGKAARAAKPDWSAGFTNLENEALNAKRINDKLAFSEINSRGLSADIINRLRASECNK